MKPGRFRFKSKEEVMEKYERYEKYDLHLTDRDELVREKVRLQKEGWEFHTEDWYDLADRTRVYRLQGIKYKKKECEEKDEKARVTIGGILKVIRIKNGWTLREFCIQHKLDAMRYSMIERNELAPNMEELSRYLNLTEQKKMNSAVITKDVQGFEIRMFVRDMILPEIIEAVRNKSSSLRDGLKEALGLK